VVALPFAPFVGRRGRHIDANSTEFASAGRTDKSPIGRVGSGRSPDSGRFEMDRQIEGYAAFGAITMNRID